MTTDSTFNVWEGIYSSFAAAPASGSGFESDTWRDRSVQFARETLAKLRAGHPLDYSLRQRNAILPTLAAVLMTQQTRIDILDFGGGPGFGFMALSAAVPEAALRTNYYVVEIDQIGRAGEALFADCPGPVFRTKMPSGKRFDIVYSSSTVQYIEDWRENVRLMAASKPRFLVYSDVFAGAGPSFVTLQNYYGSRIRHWFFNMNEFVSEVESHGYVLGLRSTCEVQILGRHGPLPMDNFPEPYRLRNTLHLLFWREDASLATADL